MNNSYIHIQTETLNNNCPECFSTDGLQLNFSQKITETRFYKAVTNDVICELRCKVCDTDIFPVRWTDDIERIIGYKKKAFTPKSKSFKLKRITWIFLIILDILVLLGILLAAGVIKI